MTTPTERIGMTKKKLARMLKGMDGNIFTLGEYEYRVELGYGGVGRRVVRSGSTRPQEDENPAPDTVQGDEYTPTGDTIEPDDVTDRDTTQEENE